MSKIKTVYVCQSCSTEHPKWQGKCNGCSEWNTLVEQTQKPSSTASATPNRYSGYGQRSELTLLKDVTKTEHPRIITKSNELNRVLGNGLVPGSVLLIGGDPGIGKSTLLLQTMDNLAETLDVVYVTGEESKEQIALRATRLDVKNTSMRLLAESNLELILEMIETEKPGCVVIDSIQTVYSDALQSAPGSVGQIKESAAQLSRLAKSLGITMFFVGHVTKDGQLAGPRVLEHIVDTVLYFEGDEAASYRLLRAQKNRYGAVNEVGVFAMTEEGLMDVDDPSAIFLGQDRTPTPGSCVTVTQEGSRGILVEIQALVDESRQPNPRRLGLGVDPQRLAMILAVLHKSCKMATYDCEIFVSAIGGLKLVEPAIDLAIMLALISSIKESPLPEHLTAFGEVDLTGKVRPVNHSTERLKEAEKMGFKHIIIPYGNIPKKPMKQIQCHPVKSVMDVLYLLEKIK